MKEHKIIVGGYVQSCFKEIYSEERHQFYFQFNVQIIGLNPQTTLDLLRAYLCGMARAYLCGMVNEHKEVFKSL